MSLLPMWTASAWAWCASTILADDDGPSDQVWWPTASDPVGPDTIVIVSQSGLGQVGAVQILDPTGFAVPASRIDVSDGAAVFVPDAPLSPGSDYEVVTETTNDGPHTFDVVDVPVGEIPPTPFPVRRQLYADAVFLDERCPDEAYTRHEVEYRLCEETALIVAVVADTEPAAPASIADVGPVDAIGGGDGIDIVSSALGVGAPATLWIGSFDGGGRFGGWVADALTVPESGTIRFDEPDDDGYVPNTTAFYDCPTEPVSWVTTFEQTCASWTQSGLECNDDDRAEENDTSDAGCSCATGPSTGGFAGGSGGLFTLLFAWRRRR
jgi:hypothetical protein